MRNWKFSLFVAVAMAVTAMGSIRFVEDVLHLPVLRHSLSRGNLASLGITLILFIPMYLWAAKHWDPFHKKPPPPT
jgi:hypothetical protein